MALDVRGLVVEAQARLAGMTAMVALGRGSEAIALEAALDVLPEIQEQVENALRLEIPKAVIKYGVKQVLFCGDRLHVLQREVLIPGATPQDIKAALGKIEGIVVTETWHYVIANFDVPENQ